MDWINGMVLWSKFVRLNRATEEEEEKVKQFSSHGTKYSKNPTQPK